MTTQLHKELIARADIVFGLHTYDDSRGTQEAINATHIPFTTLLSVSQALDDRYTKQEVIDAYAKILGSSNIAFDVAIASTDTQAVPKLQMDTLLADKASVASVATKAEKANVLLSDGSSPLLTITLDAQPVNKKYVDEKIIDIGAGDMNKATYDTDSSGRVDTTEGVGVASETMGISSYNQIMRLGQSNLVDCNSIDTFGIFVGTDVANSPISGGVVLEQFLAISTGKVQRLTDSAGTVYNRYYDANSTMWSLWKAVGVAGDFLPLDGSENMTGSLALNNNLSVTIDDLFSTPRTLLSFPSANMNPMLGEAGSSMDVSAVLVLLALPTTTVAPTENNHITNKMYVDTENTAQDEVIALNTAKVGITVAQSDAIVANTAKVGVTTEVKSTGEGGTTILNMVSMTQATYDALTPIATTLYVIQG